MLIQDVIGELRETQLRQQLIIRALQEKQATLERFTWNMMRLLSAEKNQPILDTEVEILDGSTPVYEQTLIDSLFATEAGVGPSGSDSQLDGRRGKH